MASAAAVAASPSSRSPWLRHDQAQAYQRVNRDGTLGRFLAIGAGGVRRTFDTLDDAREFRDREAQLTREEQASLKPQHGDRSRARAGGPVVPRTPRPAGCGDESVPRVRNTRRMSGIRDQPVSHGMTMVAPLLLGC